ncbi:TIGR03667 family PPOX class F420-dependent oxidoreductase [Pseudonocardia sp. CA-107938]|uniref:TIGR03667 family PPOX class F420-dependent oxidoreductase n=1 Tax=Pseudonocardia sp. CA-107938 TaxID=3240021 RepID=UPI003D91FEC0
MPLLPDPSTEFGARVAKRLDDEVVAWLTVVDSSGVPQPAPVWFLWDGESALIYSRRDARRLAHLATRPQVALHLNSSASGGDIVVLTGEITVDSAAPAPQDNPPYLAKYGDRIANGSWRTPEVFAETYGVPLRFTPRRVRGF